MPGVVITHSPAATRIYIGSPSIAVLPDGSYVASHDFFGPGSKANSTAVYGSADRGLSWKPLAIVQRQYWSTLFVHRGALYLLGTRPGPVAIRRSNDGGTTWTEPKDAESGLLTAGGHYHCAPVPVVVHHWRIWRALEESALRGFAGLQPLMMSAPEDADLLQAANWTFSDRRQHQPQWLPGGEFRGWLEGNAVIAPDGGMANVLRLHTYLPDEKAAVIHYSADGRSSSFDPAQDVIAFPGGAKKFTIRRDPRDGTYWSLANWVPEAARSTHPSNNRNALALISSPNLRDWSVRTVVLWHADEQHYGFQYADWQFDGEDLIATVRTAFGEGEGGAHSFHDANFLTFHRIANFRTKTMQDSVPMNLPAQTRTETTDLTLTGRGWSLARFDEGGQAFANRSYRWRDVPDQFRGWQFTQTGGGERALVMVKAKRDTTLFVATTAALKKTMFEGWTALPSGSFHYADKGHTPMALFSRAVKAGEEVSLPQINWSGTLVLLPPGPQGK
jgi:hypothetical protein